MPATVTESGPPKTMPELNFPKQAVVVIHGMGEQRPMDTLKAFVKAVGQDDPVITNNALPYPTDVWSKPDIRTGSLELRRITTRESIKSTEFPNGVRTDFYELYWADLTAGTSWEQFVGSIPALLFRPWSRVPPKIRTAWLLLWLLSAVVAFVALIAVLPEEIRLPWLFGYVSRAAFVALALVGGWSLRRFAQQTFGRVVRYTRADPDKYCGSPGSP